MYVLNAEPRDTAVKAKKLRRDGYTSGSIYGGNMKETLHIQLQEKEAKKLLKEKSKGGTVTVKCGDNQYQVIIKDISYNTVKNQIEDIYFQKLVDNEKVTASAKIVLINRDMVQALLQQLMDEIPYRALPADLTEEIQIDLSLLTPGSNLKVSDLPFWNDPATEVLVGGDLLVLTLAGNRKETLPETTEE